MVPVRAQHRLFLDPDLHSSVSDCYAQLDRLLDQSQLDSRSVDKISSFKKITSHHYPHNSIILPYHCFRFVVNTNNNAVESKVPPFLPSTQKIIKVKSILVLENSSWDSWHLCFTERAVFWSNVKWNLNFAVVNKKKETLRVYVDCTLSELKFNSVIRFTYFFHWFIRSSSLRISLFVGGLRDKRREPTNMDRLHVLTYFHFVLFSAHSSWDYNSPHHDNAYQQRPCLSP